MVWEDDVRIVYKSPCLIMASRVVSMDVAVFGLYVMIDDSDVLEAYASSVLEGDSHGV